MKDFEIIKFYVEETANPTLIMNTEGPFEQYKMDDESFENLIEGIDFSDEKNDEEGDDDVEDIVRSREGEVGLGNVSGEGVEWGEEWGHQPEDESNDKTENDKGKGVCENSESEDMDDSSDSAYSQPENDVESDDPSDLLQDLEASSDDDIFTGKECNKQDLVNKLKKLKKTKSKRGEVQGSVGVEEEDKWCSEGDDEDDLRSLEGSDEDEPRHPFYRPEELDMKTYDPPGL